MPLMLLLAVSSSLRGLQGDCQVQLMRLYVFLHGGLLVRAKYHFFYFIF